MGSDVVQLGDHRSPVTSDYQPPFEFTGKIYIVIVDGSGERIEDKEAITRMVWCGD